MLFLPLLACFWLFRLPVCLPYNKRLLWLICCGGYSLPCVYNLFITGDIQAPVYVYSLFIVSYTSQTLSGGLSFRNTSFLPSIFLLAFSKKNKMPPCKSFYNFALLVIYALITPIAVTITGSPHTIPYKG